MGINITIQHDTAADLARIQEIAQLRGWRPTVRPRLPDGSFGPEEPNPVSAKQHLAADMKAIYAAQLRAARKQAAADAAANDVEL